jgi:YD repeat-containing protein
LDELYLQNDYSTIKPFKVFRYAASTVWAPIRDATESSGAIQQGRLDCGYEGSNCFEVRFVNGARTQITQYDSQRKPAWETRYVYDQKGRLLEKTYQNFVREYGGKYSFTYDGYGRLVAVTEHDGNIKKGTTTYQYNAAGILVEENRSNAKDGNYFTLKKTIDSDRRVTEIDYYSGLKLMQKTTYEYVNSGNKIIETIADYAKGRKYFIVKEYDATKNTIAIAVNMPDGKAVKSDLYQYNDSGAIVDEKHFEAGILASYSTRDTKGNKKTFGHNDRIYETVYNSKGDVSEENMYYKDGKLWTQALYEYVYDIKGNWIKRIDREDGKATFVTVREIEYHP